MNYWDFINKETAIFSFTKKSHSYRNRVPKSLRFRENFYKSPVLIRDCQREIRFDRITIEQAVDIQLKFVLSVLTNQLQLQEKTWDPKTHATVFAFIRVCTSNCLTLTRVNRSCEQVFLIS